MSMFWAEMVRRSVDMKRGAASTVHSAIWARACSKLRPKFPMSSWGQRREERSALSSPGKWAQGPTLNAWPGQEEVGRTACAHNFSAARPWAEPSTLPVSLNFLFHQEYRVSVCPGHTTGCSDDPVGSCCRMRLDTGTPKSRNPVGVAAIGNQTWTESLLPLLAIHLP